MSQCGARHPPTARGEAIDTSCHHTGRALRAACTPMWWPRSLGRGSYPPLLAPSLRGPPPRQGTERAPRRSSPATTRPAGGGEPTIFHSRRPNAPATTPTQADDRAPPRIARLVSKRTLASGPGRRPDDPRRTVSVVPSRPSAPSSYLEGQDELPLDRTSHNHRHNNRQLGASARRSR